MAQPTPHSRYGGSSAARVMKCAGSVALSARVPEPPSSRAALEGNYAHEWAALCLQRGVRDAKTLVKQLLPYDTRGKYLDLTGQDRIPAQVFSQHLSEDVARSINIYLDAVYDELDQAEDAILLVEATHTLTIPGLDGVDAGGTVDAAVYTPSRKRLAAFDYKNGYEPVDAADNEQLQFYVMTLLQAHPEWQVADLELAIVQPNGADADAAGAVKSWPVDILALYGFFDRYANAVRRAELIARGDEVLDAELSVGPHCKYCPAGGAGICSAQERKALATAQLDYQGVQGVAADLLPRPEDLDADRIAAILASEEIFAGWFKQVRQYATDMVKAERLQVPGFKLVPSQARAKFVEAEETVAGHVCFVYGLDYEAVMPRSLVGITEMKRLIKERWPGKEHAGFRTQAEADIRLKFTTRESSGYALVPVSDPREPVNAIAADYGTVNLDGLPGASA